MSREISHIDKSAAINRRPGGRSARVRQAVMTATLEELEESGYEHFTIANVARRAGVHETTIYRKWQIRENVLIDACSFFVDAHMPVPDTGDLAKDLRTSLENLVKLIDTPVGRALISLAFSAGSIPEFRRLARDFWDARIAIGQKVITRAIEAGNWPKSYDASEVFSLLMGPMIVRRFLLEQEITPAMIDSSVAHLLSIAIPG